MANLASTKNDSMMYVSTRGAAAPADFEEVLLAGLAPDGGLYMPASWPQLSSLPASPAGHYAAAAAHIMTPYTGGNPGHDDLFTIVSDAYASFSHPETAPLREIGPDLFLLELFFEVGVLFLETANRLVPRLQVPDGLRNAKPEEHERHDRQKRAGAADAKYHWFHLYIVYNPV